MRRNLAWAAVLLTVVALALPAAAAPRAAGTGGIHGVITDSVTGEPFDLTGGGLISVDVFNLATEARSVVWIQNTDDGQYSFTGLAAGSYKMRFRYSNSAGDLAAYRWYNDKASFTVATPVTVIAGASLQADTTLKPLRGAGVSGAVSEMGTGLPLGTICYSIELYEASGIGLGLITWPDEFGNWEIPGVPVGRWTALVHVLTGVFDPDGDIGPELPVDCGTSPSHMDTWYGGASGWPISTGLIADPHTFPTADTFGVANGIQVTAIDIAMPPAPTCRGKVPTIFGTTLADTINGTAARDIISGLAGADVINGLGGNDLICGDRGNDTIDGGPGLKDVAVGGMGTDACNAETMIGCEIIP